MSIVLIDTYSYYRNLEEMLQEMDFFIETFWKHIHKKKHFNALIPIRGIVSFNV